MTTLTLSFSAVKNILPTLVRGRHPIMFRAPHGVGKSEMVYWMKDFVPQWLELQMDEFPVVERRASQMADAGDLMGLPFDVGDATAFKSMLWFKKACDEPVILFFDELDRANLDVRQAIFEIADSRKIAGQKLHPDTIIVACCNSGVEGTDYQVGDMDPAELDRWSVFDIRPTVEEWLIWAKDKVSEHVFEFIRTNPNMLEHVGEHETNTVYPSRRSWVRFDKELQDSKLLANKKDDEKAPIDVLYLAAGKLGGDVASAFHDFVSSYKNQVTVDELLNDKKATERLKNFEVNEHIALIGKLEQSDLIKEELSAEQIKNLAKYIFCLKGELVMKLWSVVTSANSQNGIALHQTSYNRKKVFELLKEVNTKKD